MADLGLLLQEKKLLVFEGNVGKDAEALGRLTEDDLRFLFACLGMIARRKEKACTA